MRVQGFGEIEDRLTRAAGLGEEFAAGWEAFQFIVMAADYYCEHTSAWFAKWMSVIPPACEGRDYIGLAPSLRRQPASSVEIPDLQAISEDDAAAGLASIAKTLRKRLEEMSAAAPGAADARGCTHAAGAAAEIYDLLAVDV
jgi:hypothetical protein